MTCPGSARSRTSHRATPAWAAPRFPTDPVRSGASTPSRTPRLAAAARTARTCRPVTIAWSTSPSASPASFSAAAKASRASGHVELLAEALLPDVRVRLAGHAPAVEELVARRAAARPARRRRRPARTRRRPHRPRCHAPRPSRPGRCAGPRGRPAWCGHAAAPRRRRRPAPAAASRRPSATSRRSRTRRSHGRARARRARSWRSSCRDTPGSGVERNRSCTDPAPGPTARARRPASTASVVVSSSWEATARVPLPAAAPQHAGDGRALEAPEGQVRPPCRDPAGHGPIITDVPGTSTRVERAQDRRGADRSARISARRASVAAASTSRVSSSSDPASTTP